MRAPTSTDPLDDKEEADRPPGRSGTPTAWAALAVIVVVAGIWMFADALTCLMLRAGIAAASWHRGESVQIARLSLNAQGNIEAHGVEWSHGTGNHRSTIKSDWVILRPVALRTVFFPKPGEKRLWIRELALGKTRLLLDFRGGSPGDSANVTTPAVSGSPGFPPPFPPSLLPASLAAGPVNAVLIGEGNRLEANDLWVMLPAGWPGRVSFSSLAADCGSWHRAVPAASCEALWESGSLRLGSLGLGTGLSLGEFTLTPAADRLEFGLRGTIGKGLLRGDGSLGVGKNHADLEVTLVGERLGLEAFNDLLAGEKRATGLISQARFTFRGDPARPLEADGSVRVIAKNFRWEGRGWESLRLAATLTGRTLSVSELSLRQGENEVEAEGRSTLPADWRLLLRAPFSANFRAQLENAGSLSALAGSDLSGLGSLGGGLSLEGEVHGADNRAEGYCNLSGIGTRLRELPLDWVKGWLLFEGDKTHLLSLTAQSGADRLELKGTVGNSWPHVYEGSAEVSVANFSKRLAQLGIAPTAVTGGGALTGTWQGGGSMTNHAGTFQARVMDWVGRWTPSGITGSFEGAYAPGHLELSKAEFRQGDLRLGLRMNATPQFLTVSGISARREEKTKPLLEGSFTLPVDGTCIFQSASMLGTLAMDRPLAAALHLHGLPAGEFADMLGQPPPFAGLLEGDLNVGGTPATPALHIAIKAAQFAPHGAAPAGDLTLGAQTSEGKTVVKLAMEPASSTPLAATAALPLRLAMKGDTLRLADDEEPLSGNATLRGLSIESWSGFFGGSVDGMLRKAVADGEITLSGSARKPVFAGRVVLRAAESAAINGQCLSNLELPFTLDGGRATLGEKAVATFAGKQVSLGGSIDWTEGSLDADMTLRGSGLPIFVGGGISTTGTAELSLTRREGKDPLLSGTVTLQPAATDLKCRLLPAFVPPALFQPPVAEAQHEKKAPSGLQLDLAVTTEAREATAGTGPLITMDLHLKGSPEAPLANGTLTALNQTLLLPAGDFVLPSAKVTVEQSVPRLDEGMACGFIRSGFCTLSPTGSLTAPSVTLNGYGEIGAPDLVMELATLQGKLSSTAVIRQGTAWLRQEALLPVAASDWITRRMGVPEAGSLGFYGSPWNWTAAQSPSTQQ